MIFRTLLSRTPTRVFCSNLSGPSYLPSRITSVRFFSEDRKPIKTLEHQNKLGKLPVPDLKDTVTKFLKTAQPHLTESEFSETSRKAAELVKPGGTGEHLHHGLVERSKKLDSWFADWWLDMAYLEYRDRLPVWSSPGFAYPVTNFVNETGQLKYAAKIVTGALDYKDLLDKQLLPPDMLGQIPLDMIQYYMLYGVHRFPEAPKDRLTFNTNSKYIVVAHNNNFFKVNVYEEDGAKMSQQKIEALLQKVVSHSKKLGKGTNVGILTSEHRDKWSESFQVLTSSNAQNASSVEAIEKSLFLLCLDGSSKGFDRTSDPASRTALMALHGLGSEFNSSNRWFDKTLQFFVGADGENGLTMEHSPSDGVAVVAMSDHILKKVFEEKGEDQDQGEVQVSDLPVEHLPFVVNDQLAQHIQEAEVSLQSLIDDLELEVLISRQYGKNFIKSQKFSPDSFVQMAIQYAFYRIHKTPGAHYESGSTRMFQRGRTEVIRSCSNESINFAKAMMNKGLDKETQFQAMCEAIRGHSDYAKNAVRGLGVDRLLQGMRRLAQETNVPLPELYDDPGYVRSSRMRLSTSQISGKYLGTFACFGPLQLDGYGVCYSIHNNCILFSISSLKSNPDTNNKKFYDALQECLLDMSSVCPVSAA